MYWRKLQARVLCEESLCSGTSETEKSLTPISNMLQNYRHKVKYGSGTVRGETFKFLPQILTHCNIIIDLSINPIGFTKLVSKGPSKYAFRFTFST